jgi:hypothetical protein
MADNVGDDQPHGELSRRSVILPVPFVPQQRVWDCGLACCAMVLSWRQHQEVTLEDTYGAFLRHSLHFSAGPPAPSTWTLDLLGILIASDHGLDVSSPASHTQGLLFSTVAEGMDPGRYENIGYYADTLAEDAERLGRVLSYAKEKSWPIVRRHVPLKEVLDDLMTGQVAYIALVDAKCLRCPCSSMTVRCVQVAAECVERCCMQASGCCCSGGRSPLDTVENDSASAAAGVSSLLFLGHFIVLCGYDPHNRLLVYRNPAKQQAGLCVMDAAVWEKARRRRGTDEDLIRVHV